MFSLPRRGAAGLAGSLNRLHFDPGEIARLELLALAAPAGFTGAAARIRILGSGAHAGGLVSARADRGAVSIVLIRDPSADPHLLADEFLQLIVVAVAQPIGLRCRRALLRFNAIRRSGLVALAGRPDGVRIDVLRQDVLIAVAPLQASGERDRGLIAFVFPRGHARAVLVLGRALGRAAASGYRQRGR